MVKSSSARTDLTELIASVPTWYHTIEFAPGVLTPGWFDHRAIVPRLPMPASLKGLRCLDVATFDGFWAFEMERRGAAEVMAIDVVDYAGWDWPAGAYVDVGGAAGPGFVAARQQLGSSVERRLCSVYDFDPARVGQFDFIYLGSLLLHLRDPVLALKRVRSVCRGQLLVVDAIDLSFGPRFANTAVASLEGLDRPWWWKPNLAGLARMITAAGFTIARQPEPLLLPYGVRQAPIGGIRQSLAAARRAWRARCTWDDVIRRSRQGDPHGVILARPANSVA